MFVYILRCADASLYVGHAADVSKREQEHNAGTGAVYTASRRPVVVVYAEDCHSRPGAIARERQLKGWSVAKKEALINGNSAHLKTLSKRRVFKTRRS